MVNKEYFMQKIFNVGILWYKIQDPTYSKLAAVHFTMIIINSPPHVGGVSPQYEYDILGSGAQPSNPICTPTTPPLEEYLNVFCNSN